jgi:hypothetical protein
VQVQDEDIKLRYYVRPVSDEIRTEVLRKLLQAVEREAQRRMENIDEDIVGVKGWPHRERNLGKGEEDHETSGQPKSFLNLPLSGGRSISTEIFHGVPKPISCAGKYKQGSGQKQRS